MCGGCPKFLLEQGRSSVFVCDSCGVRLTVADVYGEGVDLCEECMGMHTEQRAKEDARNE